MATVTLNGSQDNNRIFNNPRTPYQMAADILTGVLKKENVSQGDLDNIETEFGVYISFFPIKTEQREDRWQ